MRILLAVWANLDTFMLIRFHSNDILCLLLRLRLRFLANVYKSFNMQLQTDRIEQITKTKNLSFACVYQVAKHEAVNNNI